MRVHGAAARETDGGRCFAEGCRWLYGFGEGVDYTEAASYLKRAALSAWPSCAPRFR